MKELKFANYTIGFKELPNEVSLIVELSDCENNCKGCHSPHLRGNYGTPVTELYSVISKYEKHITAICFLGHGGELQQDQFTRLLTNTKFLYPNIKLGLYSGLDDLITRFMPYLEYYKVGKYIEEFGGLESPSTNQIMYLLRNGSRIQTIEFY